MPTSKLKSQLTSQVTSKSQASQVGAQEVTSKSKASQVGAQDKALFKTGSQQEVQKVVESNKVVVFAKTYCPYCKKAKKLLESLGVEFVAIELDELGELGKTVQESLEEMTNQSTVPSVFANQEHLGGSDDLAKLVESDRNYFERL
jgi:glutaredoxin